MFEKIFYQSLNARQRENYNFHKVAAVLADYGYNSIRLSDDWEGADFLAVHCSGDHFLKVQIKGRLTVAKKYIGKSVYIAFFHDGACYVFDHDDFLSFIEENGKLSKDSSRWNEFGERRWGALPRWAFDFLQKYRL